MIENIMHFIHTQNTIHFIFPHVLNNPITLTTFMFNFFLFLQDRSKINILQSQHHDLKRNYDWVGGVCM
jgi:hypothetical protein